MTYLNWQEATIPFDQAENYYEQGFVYTRKGKGIMVETRSLRINLSEFELNSENRRVLKKTIDLNLIPHPLPYSSYTWQIGKLAKDFYETKFGPGIFSANKIKEILTEKEKSNFNLLLQYKFNNEAIGYAICFENKNILHYSYPFYDLSVVNNQQLTNIGMSMMLQAIILAKESDKKYIYLGSAQRSTDTYKLQFKGLEWWNKREWSKDIDKLKSVITS